MPAGHHRGREPRNKGVRYPADPPSVEEIVLEMRHACDPAHALRLRGLIVVMRSAALRISEALTLTESDLDPIGAILVRQPKGSKRRQVGMDQGGWALLRPSLGYWARGPPVRCSASSTVVPRRRAGRRIDLAWRGSPPGQRSSCSLSSNVGGTAPLSSSAASVGFQEHCSRFRRSLPSARKQALRRFVGDPGAR
jgi:integrase